MLYKAFVKDKETRKVNFMEYDYDSKSDFIRDLKLNGYTVIRVEPKELYDFVLDNTDADKYDWEAAKKLYKEHRPLTKEELDNEKDYLSKLYSSKQIKSSDLKVDPVSPVHPIPEKLPKKEEKLKTAKKKLTDKNGKTFEDYLNEEATKSGYDRNHEAIDKLFNVRRLLNED